MDSEYIQALRYKLQKRLKRLNSADWNAFHSSLKQAWGFLQENEITKAILEDLEHRSQTEQGPADDSLGGTPNFGETEREHDGISYWIIKKAALGEGRDILTLGHALERSSTKHADAVEAFRVNYLEPLFDYIDEHIDDRRSILALLKKYKHRCEWFHRAQLYDKFKDDTGHGERNLAKAMYEYLHDQGIEFHVEPESASGRVDLISTQTGRDRLIADAKLFNPGRGQDLNYLSKGFRQVYEYTKDFDELFGYLVIFKTGPDDLSVQTKHQEGAVPFVTHNNKTIFLLVIDIYEDPAPASKRGKIKAHELTPDLLVAALGA
jgi:hypothetical protein